MLQWMGGSRRKVTTSRLSTQKRQKQYFDQRKRQQLKQQSGEERFTDGSNPFTHQANNRSLDILSLLNVPTVVQNFNSSCYSGEDIDGGNLALDCHRSKGQPIIQTVKGTPKDPSGFREEEYQPAGQVENLYPTEYLSGDHDIQTRDLIANHDRIGKLKLGNEHRCQAETKCEKKTSEGETVEPIRPSDRRNKWKKANGSQLSMFDLLGDDGSNSNEEDNPSCEAHVAFSMKGLGEMGTETPVHSPEQPFRMFSYGDVSPVKSRRQLKFSKNLDDILYDLEVETAAVARNIELPLYGSSFEAPLFSEDIYNPFEKAEKMSSCSDPWRFTKDGGKSKNYFADDETFWEIDDGTDDKWNGPPEDCYTSRKNSPYRKDEISADYWNIGIQEASDFNSLDPVPKIRVSEKTRKFSISGYDYEYYSFVLANPYCKQRKIEKDSDLRASAAWPSHLTEDAEDSLSLRSEESCSSTAEARYGKTPLRSSMASQTKEWYDTSTSRGGPILSRTSCEPRSLVLSE